MSKRTRKPIRGWWAVYRRGGVPEWFTGADETAARAICGTGNVLRPTYGEFRELIPPAAPKRKGKR